MALGVLLDTFVVRSVLVPALTFEVEERIVVAVVRAAFARPFLPPTMRVPERREPASSDCLVHSLRSTCSPPSAAASSAATVHAS